MDSLEQLRGATGDRLLQLELDSKPSGSQGREYYFSVASEEPVRMAWGDEILSHAREAVNLSRVNSMALLWEHGKDPTVGSRPIGRVSQWDLRGSKSYCKIRWSNTAIAQEIRELVDDGTIGNVSIRYEIGEAKQRGEQVVITRWTPVHVSFVSDPADPTVGIGRAYKSKVNQTFLEENSMGDQIPDNSSTAIAFEADAERAAIREQEIERAKAIRALCKNHNLANLAEDLIAAGKNIEESRMAVLDKIEQGYQARSLSGSDVTLAGFGQPEDKEYSLLGAIRSICPGFAEYNKNCFEREVSEEISQKLGRTTAGVFVPVRHLTVGGRTGQRDALTTAGTPSNLIDIDFRPNDFIEALRNKAMVFQLGARFMTGLKGPVEIPKQSGVSASYWIGENQTIGPESDLQFSQIGMSQKTIVSRVSMSRNLLMQSSLSVENIVREDMVKELALAIDRAAINGSGVGPEPKGILNYAINSVSLGTDGAAPTYSDLVALCSEIEVDNADVSTMKFLTNTRVKSKLMLTPMQANGVEGNFVLKEGASTLMGYSFNVTNQIPSNLTKGNGTNLSAIILGCWDQLIVGEWGVLEILPNVYGKTYETGGVEIRAIKSLDMALRYDESFAAITDAVTTL